ncbi:MAG TPA: GNAT family N-acetyltransferase [Flavobacteriaceae bacterium]|nr:GNAT family N-acetyltransferase [Bacteroidota bacterium]HPF11145.1 GNAT family N-acetyltransferase [Flavobacteriaceae bacterium]HRW43735.1 GNAT family N-acetyltransferase [Flavobacteriaceae bacterium]
MKNPYLFTSERLGFRNWTQNDLPEFANLNADAAVMEHFPNPLSQEETAAFIDRLQQHYATHGYNYFAVEVLKSGEWIGFIGLAYQDYPSPYTPAVDIGWRLKKSAWGNGYATEGAHKCLEYAFGKLQLKEVISTCTLQNARSEKVMQKIGMQRLGTFHHPKLQAHPEYEKCVCYSIRKEAWK